jgi:hydrogenase/urease accessory protein HupE
MRRGALLVLALLVPAAGAHGHAFAPAVLELDEGVGGRITMRWKPPREVVTPLRPVLPGHCRALGGEAAGTEVQWLRFDCGPDGLAGHPVGVDGLAAAGVEAIVRVVFADGREEHGILRDDGGPLVVPRAPTGPAVAWRWLGSGVTHILGGPDHLLLILGLLLLVRGGRPLVWTITAFTVAHSVTLAVATLDLVRVSPRPIEALIAASIVLVALELVRPADAPPTLLATRPWIAAFALGLLHGLGFAGALASTGLPSRHLAVALVAFNAGVEIGQLAFVAALAGPLLLFRRAAAARPWVHALPAYAIGALAVRWTLERLGG